MFHGEIFHLVFHIGMAHRKWGKCGCHVERTKALWRSGMRVENTVDKAKDREERRLGAAADKLAEERRRCRHGGRIILIFVYEELMLADDRWRAEIKGGKAPIEVRV